MTRCSHCFQVISDERRYVIRSTYEPPSIAVMHPECAIRYYYNFKTLAEAELELLRLQL